jgi:hypothetical protein
VKRPSDDIDNNCPKDLTKEFDDHWRDGWKDSKGDHDHRKDGWKDSKGVHDQWKDGWKDSTKGVYDL